MGKTHFINLRTDLVKHCFFKAHAIFQTRHVCHQWSTRPDPHSAITTFTWTLLCLATFRKVGTDARTDRRTYRQHVRNKWSLPAVTVVRPRGSIGTPMRSLKLKRCQICVKSCAKFFAKIVWSSSHEVTFKKCNFLQQGLQLCKHFFTRFRSHIIMH